LNENANASLYKMTSSKLYASKIHYFCNFLSIELRNKIYRLLKEFYMLFMFIYQPSSKNKCTILITNNSSNCLGVGLARIETREGSFNNQNKHSTNELIVVQTKSQIYTLIISLICNCSEQLNDLNKKRIL